MCSLSILIFVSSNRIDRLQVRIVFHEDSEVSVKSQGVYVSTIILSTVFFVYYHRFSCSELKHYPFFWFLQLLFICYNSFLVTYPFIIIVDFQRLLQDLIYVRLSRVTNRRSLTETKSKIMQLNLYLIPISQATYGTK